VGTLLAFFPRTVVAEFVVDSPEAQQRLVGAAYGQYLHRTADPGGLNSFVAYLGQGIHFNFSKQLFFSDGTGFNPVQQSTGQDQVVAALVSSAEYMAAIQPTAPTPTPLGAHSLSVVIQSPQPGLLTNQNVTVTGRAKADPPGDCVPGGGRAFRRRLPVPGLF
jgi:hypothetical protein